MYTAVRIFSQLPFCSLYLYSSGQAGIVTGASAPLASKQVWHSPVLELYIGLSVGQATHSSLL